MKAKEINMLGVLQGTRHVNRLENSLIDSQQMPGRGTERKLRDEEA
jgi:hypothetical protein